MLKPKIKLQRLDRESREFLLEVMRKTQAIEVAVNRRLNSQDKLLNKVYQFLKEKELV